MILPLSWQCFQNNKKEHYFICIRTHMHCSGLLQSPFLQPVLHNATKNKEIRCELGVVHNIKLRYFTLTFHSRQLSFLIPFSLLKRNNFSLYAHLKSYFCFLHGRTGDNILGGRSPFDRRLVTLPPLQFCFA
jgi:hypothetical protein